MPDKALSGPNRLPRNPTDSTFLPIGSGKISSNIEKESCYTSCCLSRIWKCVKAVFKKFVDWVACRSAKKDKVENQSSFVSFSSSNSAGTTSSIPPDTASIKGQSASDNELATSASQPQASSSLIISQGNATAEEFVECVGDGSISIEQTRAFLKRGGILNIATSGRQPIAISAKESVITGCRGGIYRSQVAAAIMIKMGITVRGVLSGCIMEGDIKSYKGIGIISDFTKSPDNLPDCCSKEFLEVFGMEKQDQIGRQYAVSIPVKESPNDLEGSSKEQDKRTEIIKRYYQEYINQLSSTHFIIFSQSGPEVLKCLLNREGSLENFIVTYCPLGDKVKWTYPTYSSFGDKIKWAYPATATKILRDFEEEVTGCFNFVNIS